MWWSEQVSSLIDLTSTVIPSDRMTGETFFSSFTAPVDPLERQLTQTQALLMCHLFLARAKCERENFYQEPCARRPHHHLSRICISDLFLLRGCINHFCIHTYSESYIYRLLDFRTLQIWILNGNYARWQLCRPEFSANELSRLPSMYLTHGFSIVCMC